MIKVKVRPRLKEILDQKGWTQEYLSQKSGVPQSAISRFDRSSQRKDQHLFALKHSLGLQSVDELFEVTIEE
jgi:transcriptional regulator with XRE-family HTH domain